MKEEIELSPKRMDFIIQNNGIHLAIEMLIAEGYANSNLEGRKLYYQKKGK